jgi:hypothetical protein
MMISDITAPCLIDDTFPPNWLRALNAIGFSCRAKKFPTDARPFTHRLGMPMESTRFARGQISSKALQRQLHLRPDHKFILVAVSYHFAENYIRTKNQKNSRPENEKV